MTPTIAAIVCAYNEARFIAPCLHSLLAQTRPADEILVINNASTDETGALARGIPGVRVVDEPVKGLLVARKTARRATSVNILAYVDADCRVPLQWLERIERRFAGRPAVLAVTGPYRYTTGTGPGGRRFVRTTGSLRRRRTFWCSTAFAGHRARRLGSTRSYREFTSFHVLVAPPSQDRSIKSLQFHEAGSI